MENDLTIKFKQENVDISINILQPDFANMIHEIVSNNLQVIKENMDIQTDNTEFDTEEFMDILISVHEEFAQEIEDFYKNIQEEIKTYYADEELSAKIIQELKKQQNVS